MGKAGGAAPGGIGRRGEAVATRFLVGRGWRVLGRNLRFPGAELDLVVRKGEVLAFIEVKARIGGFPIPERIHSGKRRRVILGARNWLAKHPSEEWGILRFDALLIRLDAFGGPAGVRHWQDAWRS